MKYFYAFCLTFMLAFQLKGQNGSAPFVQHFELGAMLGTAGGETRINGSLYTLHGFRFHKQQIFGLLAGIDMYPLAKVMPIGVGWRGMADANNPTTWIGGMDLAFGSMMLEKREVIQNQHLWIEGGIMARPTIGFLMRNKRENAWTFTLGYKFQRIFQFAGLSAGELSGAWSPDPEDWIWLRQDKISYNSLIFSVGYVFL